VITCNYRWINKKELITGGERDGVAGILNNEGLKKKENYRPRFRLARVVH
jgi:hypothetical protein